VVAQAIAWPATPCRPFLAYGFSDDDHTAKGMDVAKREQLFIIQHTDSVLHVSFSADSKIVATASDDHTAKVMDVAKREQLFIIIQHTNSVNHVSFSADSKMVATTPDDNTAKLHDSNLDDKDHLGSLVLSLQKRDLLTAFGWLPILDVCAAAAQAASAFDC